MTSSSGSSPNSFVVNVKGYGHYRIFVQDESQPSFVRAAVDQKAQEACAVAMQKLFNEVARTDIIQCVDFDLSVDRSIEPIEYFYVKYNTEFGPVVVDVAKDVAQKTAEYFAKFCHEHYSGSSLKTIIVEREEEFLPAILPKERALSRERFVSITSRSTSISDSDSFKDFESVRGSFDDTDLQPERMEGAPPSLFNPGSNSGMNSLLHVLMQDPAYNGWLEKVAHAASLKKQTPSTSGWSVFTRIFHWIYSLFSPQKARFLDMDRSEAGDIVEKWISSYWVDSYIGREKLAGKDSKNQKLMNDLRVALVKLVSESQQDGLKNPSFDHNAEIDPASLLHKLTHLSLELSIEPPGCFPRKLIQNGPVEGTLRPCSADLLESRGEGHAISGWKSDEPSIITLEASADHLKSLQTLIQEQIVFSKDVAVRLQFPAGELEHRLSSSAEDRALLAATLQLSPEDRVRLALEFEGVEADKQRLERFVRLSSEDQKTLNLLSSEEDLNRLQKGGKVVVSPTSYSSLFHATKTGTGVPPETLIVDLSKRKAAPCQELSITLQVGEESQDVETYDINSLILKSSRKGAADHLVSLVKKENIWYLMNDSQPARILSEEEVEAILEGRAPSLDIGGSYNLHDFFPIMVFLNRRAF